MAVAMFERAIALGYTEAITGLGYLHWNGLGVAKDYSRAVALYRRAAEKNEFHAMYNLGVAYEDGRGVPQSKGEARKWYKAAADLGYEPAKQKLVQLR